MLIIKILIRFFLFSHARKLYLLCVFLSHNKEIEIFSKLDLQHRHNSPAQEVTQLSLHRPFLLLLHPILPPPPPTRVFSLHSCHRYFLPFFDHFFGFFIDLIFIKLVSCGDFHFGMTLDYLSPIPIILGLSLHLASIFLADACTEVTFGKNSCTQSA